MTHAPENFAVWTEIPVTDLDRAITFYNAVFKTDLQKQQAGPNEAAFFPTSNPAGVAGHLYPGKPAERGTGSTIHLICPDTVEETMERVIDAGGQVVSEVITIPSGSFAYCLDLDGNSIGLFLR